MKKWIKIALVCVAIVAALTIAFLAAPGSSQPAEADITTTEYNITTEHALELGLPVLATTTANALYAVDNEPIITQQNAVAAATTQPPITVPVPHMPQATPQITLSITGLGEQVILAPTQVSFYPGQSLFTVLQRETRARGIPIAHVGSPALGTVYIRGIAGLFEFDHGELSGWVYRVNGDFASIGVCRWLLQANDVVELIYTTEMVTF